MKSLHVLWAGIYLSLPVISPCGVCLYQAQGNFSEALVHRAVCSFAEVKFGHNVLQEAFRAIFGLVGWRTAKPGDASAQRLAVILSLLSIRFSGACTVLSHGISMPLVM